MQKYTIYLIRKCISFI